MIYGLDLSKHNGTVDFKAIKEAGNDFVILRAGYGVTGTRDSKFETYYKGAKKAGLKVGAYWYSYGLKSSDGKKEAMNMYEVIKGKQFEYPIYIDMEDADGYKKEHGMPSHSVLCDICEQFCSYLESKGYYVGIYASESWFNNQLKNVSDSYDKWVANWGSNDGTLQNKKTSYRLHQFTSEYRLNGKRYDRNVVYDFDYPAVIKEAGLNNLNDNNDKTSSNSKMTARKFAEEVWYEGKHGTGKEREKECEKYGVSYDEVQDILYEFQYGKKKPSSMTAKQFAKEVWYEGKHGTGKKRKQECEKYGVSYDEVQKYLSILSKGGKI